MTFKVLDAHLSEYSKAMEMKFKVKLSIPTLSMFLTSSGISRKKVITDSFLSQILSLSLQEKQLNVIRNFEVLSFENWWIRELISLFFLMNPASTTN